MFFKQMIDLRRIIEAAERSGEEMSKDGSLTELSSMYYTINPFDLQTLTQTFQLFNNNLMIIPLL
jgi:hypothetical protein